jgi:beta-glucosidase/6-phospho-beta-glucosidase/beta-galactosidase
MPEPLPPRSQLERLTEPDAFWWATGIEDTFITAPWPATGRTLDEYELTGHYERFEEDIRLIAALGVPCARYGVPWHRIQPAPDVWDFSFPDAALGRMLDAGVEPIVDLVHYGLPPWIEGAWLNPDLPARMAEYAQRMAERYAGRIRWYTPLNEPRITVWYCGKLGWWPPFARGWRGFVSVMLGVCRGIVETCHALHRVDPEIVLAHVDATDLYDTDDPTLTDEAARRQEIVFLALDLVSGRIGEGHPLHKWLLANGASGADLDYFRERAVPLDVIGMNLYPMFTQKRLVRAAGENGRMRIRMPYAGADDLIVRLGRLYHQRYGRPLWISETASMGSVAKRRLWMDDSVDACRALRAEGVPLWGYTWWPLFALVAWAYRQGTRPQGDYLVQMGLWDLDPATLGRVETPLVERFRGRVDGGSSAVGRLALARETREDARKTAE